MLCLALVGALALHAPAGRAILAFSKTAGYRHGSIPVARRALADVGIERGWTVTFTEDPTSFTDSQLKRYDAVVFLMTTGDVLDPKEQEAFTRFIHSGGGYVGVHSASDTEYDWPWYGKLVGAYFLQHPAIQDAVVKIEDTTHPSTSFLPNPWKRRDEWYDFRSNPRAQVHVLASVDLTSYTGSKMVGDHPLMWCQEFEGGRAWYTAMGHTDESYQDPQFVKMIAEGIEWACGKSKRKP